MTSIGETLRRERLRRNLDLDQISRELKISLRFLEAIEEEQFDRLPGGVFAKSFVRQYAHLLGLDEEELSSELQRTLEPAPVIQRTADTAAPVVDSSIHVPPVPEWEVGGRRSFNWSSSLPALALVVVVMLVCSLVYSYWQRTRHPVLAHEQAAAATVQPEAAKPDATPTPAVPEPSPVKTAEPATPPATSNPAVTNPATTSPPATKPAAANAAPQTLAQAQSATKSAPAKDGEPPQPNKPDNSAFRSAGPAAATPANSPAQIRPVQDAKLPPATTAAPNPNATVRVEVTAAEPVWMLAKTDGKYLFSGTLDANQTRTVEANGTVLLRLGNAGGVNITLNGKPIGSVGPKGQVRTVQFTSGGFQIVAAPKPSLPIEDLR